jgi:hypothetical protein
VTRSWLVATSAFVAACRSGGSPSQAPPAQPVAMTPDPGVPPPQPMAPAAVPGAAPAAAPPSGDAPPPPNLPPPPPEEFKAQPKQNSSVRGNLMGFPARSPVFDQPGGQELRFHLLDVEQGDSTLIECPGGERILEDGGSGISRIELLGCSAKSDFSISETFLSVL